MRSPSAGSQRSQAADYFNHPTITRSETDLTPHLSQAPEFRVPTHEAPQKVALPRINTPTPHSLHAEWVRDDQVTECLVCKRRFTFLFRKVSLNLNIICSELIGPRPLACKVLVSNTSVNLTFIF